MCLPWAQVSQARPGAPEIESIIPLETWATRHSGRFPARTNAESQGDTGGSFALFSCLFLDVLYSSLTVTFQKSFGETNAPGPHSTGVDACVHPSGLTQTIGQATAPCSLTPF